jgi:glutamyl-tRNA reductase
MPRDVDPAVRGLSGVSLYDMDDLEAVAETNKRKRKHEATKAEAIVDEEADRFMQWLSSQYVIPTVAGIRAQAEEVRNRELARIMKELPQLSEDERAKLTAFSNAMVKKVLHRPISWLKDNGDPTQVEVARKMFGLKDEGD